MQFYFIPYGDTQNYDGARSLKEHVHKHTCVIIFVILYDDKGEHKKNPTQTVWHAFLVTCQSVAGSARGCPLPGSM